MLKKEKNTIISNWLMLITFLVASMIVIGGLTRLTNSGLSITRWDLISGVLPPLNLNEWNYAFSLYKKIPEFQLINSNMNLDEFKIIYWWEYIHRIIGRIVGLFYMIPLFYFTLKKNITKNNFISLYLILILILIQGYIGWYMVQSGLTENTDVSHYRLSLHLTLAFIIYALLFWNFLKFKNYKIFSSQKKLPYYLPILFIFFVFLQISIGAFVSGLDAGKIYQTWPLMNQNYFPDDVSIKMFFSLNLFNEPSLVQFLHRNLAYIIFLLFIFMAKRIFKNNQFIYLRKIVLLIFLCLFLQILLGILTILSGAQIILASMHQIGSIFLISTSLILLFKNSRIN